MSKWIGGIIGQEDLGPAMLSVKEMVPKVLVVVDGDPLQALSDIPTRHAASAQAAAERLDGEGSRHLQQKALQERYEALTRQHSSRYTTGMLKTLLQCMGCKPRTAHKVSELIYGRLQQLLAGAEDTWGIDMPWLPQRVQEVPGRDNQVSVFLSRSEFEGLVLGQLQAWTGSEEGGLLEDLQIACSIQEQRRSVIVLLAGTSGTGKSTLAALLAARLGITTLLSTDSIRHMLRSFHSREEAPLLYASTYQAGELVPSTLDGGAGEEGQPWELQPDVKQRAVNGYKGQCELVLESLQRLIASCEARHESLVCEGVHLHLGHIIKLMAAHPSIVPFLIYISNEGKHKERFAVRAKHMTLEPGANRYVKYLKNIRTIQDYLCRRAEKHFIPKVDNTNVDRSVAAIHATVLGCLRQQGRGRPLLNPSTLTCHLVAAEYEAVKEETWSSKDMLQVIRRKAAMSAGAQAAPSAELPSSSTSTPQGPLSDLGDLQGWNLETAVQPSSVSWDSDLASSAEKEKWSETTTSEEGGGSEADEEGSVAESTASLGHDDDDEIDPAPAHLKGVA